jgi:hypothetical protein
MNTHKLITISGCEINLYLPPQKIAGVVKLVDTLDLGSSAVRCVGSSPSARTKPRQAKCLIWVFYGRMPELAQQHASIKKSTRWRSKLVGFCKHHHSGSVTLQA